MSADQRVRREVFGSNVFDRLRAALGPAFEVRCQEQVSVVTGNLTQPNLGLSDESYESLADRLTIVVNSAATVTFDERLDSAIALNILGARRLLELAKRAGDIPFMQVSTAYVGGVQTGDIPETLIPPGHTVASYLAMQRGESSGGEAPFDLNASLAELESSASRVQSECANEPTECRRRLIDLGMEYAQKHGWNDTYTLTKWMAEQFLARDRGDVPLVLFRPAIIEGSYDEPAPGWIDGLRMADPLILAFGRGKLKEFPADGNVNLDLIPVDFVANAMIATLPVGRKGPSLDVYQCGSCARNPLSIPSVAQSVKEAFRRRPMRDEAGRPIRVNDLELISKQQFLDRWEKRLKRTQSFRGLLRSTKMAQRWRKRLAAAEARIAQLIYFVKIYAPYTHLNCRYLDDRLRAVYDGMHPEDREVFPFDVTRIDWHDYIVHRHVPGVRHFVLGSGAELEAPMLAASYAVEDESPDDPSPLQVLSALRGESIYEVFENAANAYPKRIALQVRRNGRWVRYTYGDALSTTAAVARRYTEYGLQKGDHIALCSDNCPEWGLCYLAAMRQGLTVVPFDPQWLPSELASTARFARVRLICAGPRLVEPLREAISQSGSADEIRVVALDGALVPSPGAARDPGPDPAAVTGDDIASIVFTSGTTVAPKGVMLRHRNFLSNARSLVHVQTVQADDQFLSVLPLHHVFEFTGGFLVPLSYASTVTYVEEMKGPEIIRLMQATGTTVMMVVPRLLKLFHDGILRSVNEAGIVKRNLFRFFGWLSEQTGGAAGRIVFKEIHRRFGGRLRMFVCGGSSLPESLYHAFRRIGFSVCEGYGLTETSPVVTVNPAEGARAGSVGLALPEIDLDIRHQDGSGVGELWIKGPNVMAGYYGNSQATAEVLRDGWFRTGDLCRRDGEGYLYVTGRLKDVIITAAGKNVYPDEVAIHYAELPRVKESCVLGMPNADGIGDRVDLVVVLDLEKVADVDRSAVENEVRQTIAHISQRLPSYQRVQHIHFLTEDLPKTSTLKVKRQELIRLLLSEKGLDKATADPARVDAVAARSTGGDATVNESWLRDTLAALTKRPPSQIRPDANLLLDLGVDSLMKIELLGEIETRFGFRLPDEVAVRLGRVGDLISLISERVPVNGTVGRDRVARRLLAQADSRASAHDVAGRNGRTPIPLVPLRWAVRGGIGLFMHSWVRIEAVGLNHVPLSGPFVLAANHGSHLDSAAVLTAVAPSVRGTSRRVYVAGAEDYFFNTRLKSVVFGQLCDTIPFDRMADGVGGLRRCAQVLGQDQGLLVFPEGTRSLDGEIQSFKVGAAVLAVEAQAPIVPVHISNAYELLPKGRRFCRPGVVTVVFGKPIQPCDVRELRGANERHRAYRELAARLQREVEMLGRRQYTHAY